MNNILSARTALIALSLAASLAVGAQFAHAAISRQLDFGSTGSDVSQVQTYLATDASLYPQGLVTGYFGVLTRAAVQRFQVFYSITSPGLPGYGLVGPLTRAKLNSLQK